MAENADPAAWAKNEIPYPWNPKQAITLFDAINLIDVYLDPSTPMTRELMALIFFHETGFSNIRQKVGVTKSNPLGLGPGVGFGQMEVLNNDKHFAIRAHCEYFKEKFRRGAMTKRALMAAQAGGGTVNEPLIDKIMAAESKLKSCLLGASQRTIIDALNECRWYVKRDAAGKPIVTGGKVETVQLRIPAEGQFKRYWDFTVPPADLMWGIRK